jgi:enoyl-CoA hydratase/carnithine racemase
MNEVIYYSPRPVIGVFEKYAFGIATMLASWTDIALAEVGAQFGFPEVQHGITPYGAVPTMLNVVNQKALMELLLTGRRITADEAVRLGLITRAVPADQLAAELDKVLAALSRGSPAAISKTKQFVRRCETLTYQQGIEAATDRAILGLGMPELQEGLAAFLDRRSPRWA